MRVELDNGNFDINKYEEDRFEIHLFDSVIWAEGKLINVTKEDLKKIRDELNKYID
jgi:hypothetical protein